MLMKTNLILKPQTSLKTKTIFILKVTTAVGILGIVLTGVFFIISYFFDFNFILFNNYRDYL